MAAFPLNCEDYQRIINSARLKGSWQVLTMQKRALRSETHYEKRHHLMFHHGLAVSRKYGKHWSESQRVNFIWYTNESFRGGLHICNEHCMANLSSFGWSSLDIGRPVMLHFRLLLSKHLFPFVSVCWSFSHSGRGRTWVLPRALR